MTSTVVDYENLMLSSCNDTVRSCVRPRWERKQMKANMLNRSCASDTNSDNENNLRGLGQNVDRFIPNRATMDMEKSEHYLQTFCSENERDNSNAACDSSDIRGRSTSDVSSKYKSALLGVEDGGKFNRILSFRDKAPVPKGGMVNHLKVLYSSSISNKKRKSSSEIVQRHISSTPYKILDAPELLDDYYLNLLSWSKSNYLAIALSQKVYIWNAATGDIQELCSFENGPGSYISSVSWIQEGGSQLAIGTSDGTTQLWDAHAGKKLRTMGGHSQRVGALSWNSHILSSGGKDSIIVNHDVRAATHNVATLLGHTQEICGLAWSPDGTALASGANDNTLCIWDASSSSLSSPRFLCTDHQAAVKALAWSPHERNLIASGGGTADRQIKFWNTQTGALLNSIDTGSQVCSLVWNPNEKEIMSSHGYERNQLTLWKYPSMVKVKELEGHTGRVLHMACGPDGEVVSAAADETLRFWNVFSAQSFSKSKRGEHPDCRKAKLSRTMHIR